MYQGREDLPAYANQYLAVSRVSAQAHPGLWCQVLDKKTHTQFVGSGGWSQKPSFYFRIYDMEELVFEKGTRFYCHHPDVEDGAKIFTEILIMYKKEVWNRDCIIRCNGKELECSTQIFKRLLANGRLYNIDSTTESEFLIAQLS